MMERQIHTPTSIYFAKTYVGMTDEKQFSLGLTRIFNKMRDLHTLYYKAGPYSCFSLSTGLFFKFVDDSLGSSTPPKVRVVGMNDTPEILDLIGNVLSAVAVGDELLQSTGYHFMILGFGANDSGGHRGAFQYLEGVSGSSNILPEVDDITFQLKRLGGNQELYTVTVPYVALYNDECWSLLQGRNMGVIRIDSFSPVLKDTKEDTNFMVLIVTIRDLLVNQLKDTDSVLFDSSWQSSQEKPLVTNSTPKLLLVFVNWFEVATTQVNLVEDDGVKSDVVVRSTIDDILPGDKGISAYDRIAGYFGMMWHKGKWMARPISYLGHIARFVFSDSVDIPRRMDGISTMASGTIGDGVSDYSGYMASTVRVWLSAPVGSRISVSLDATVDTHEDGGYFSLDMMDDSGEIVHMLSSTSKDGLTQYKSITGRNRVIKGTYSFTVTTRMFALNMNFVSYGTESPFSVKINSIVLTKN
ncbi:hypothetical protein BASA83_004502 [Batrachochytrium salamandrivorans]|nr:hypothetical protein BASA83_004502 [Batrachochytrium salamandrivorans]